MAKENEIVLFETEDAKVKYYNLDMIISVGYRVKSRRGIESRPRCWLLQSKMIRMRV